MGNLKDISDLIKLFFDNLQDGKRQITRKDFKKACFYGGLTTGFFGVLIIWLLYFLRPIAPDAFDITGYGNMSPDEYKKQVSLIVTLLQMILGGTLGLLCASLGWPSYGTRKKRIKDTSYFFLVFVLGFVIIIISRQVMARDALCPSNYRLHLNKSDFDSLKKTPCIDASFMSKFNVDTTADSVKGKYFRLGGGILGEPDFETLATGIMGGIGFLTLVLSLLKLSNGSVPTKGALFSVAGKSTILGLIGWLSIFLIYTVLLRFCFIQKYGFIYQRWFFIFDFPHPERMYLVALLCFLYVFTILLSIRLLSKPKPDNKLNRTN